MPRSAGYFCVRNHLRRDFGYRDNLGRSRCSKCDELAKKGPLTPSKRRPRSYQVTWKWLTNQPLSTINSLLESMEEKKLITPKKALIVRLRFGLDRNGNLRTEQEVSDILKMTKPTVHQYEMECYIAMANEAARKRAEKKIESSKWEYLP